MITGGKQRKSLQYVRNSLDHGAYRIIQTKSSLSYKTWILIDDVVVVDLERYSSLGHLQPNVAAIR
jgi:hypothetical protein